MVFFFRLACSLVCCCCWWWWCTNVLVCTKKISIIDCYRHCIPTAIHTCRLLSFQCKQNANETFITNNFALKIYIFFYYNIQLKWLFHSIHVSFFNFIGQIWRLECNTFHFHWCCKRTVNSNGVLTLNIDRTHSQHLDRVLK